MLSPHQWQSIHEISLSIHRAGSIKEAIRECASGLQKMLTNATIEISIEAPPQDEDWARTCHYSRLLFERNIELPAKKELILRICYQDSPPPTDSRIFNLITEHLVSAVKHLPSLLSARMDDSPLSRRERDVFPLIVTGRTNDEIATLLGISARTVEKHVASILDKTGLDNRKLLIASFQRPNG